MEKNLRKVNSISQTLGKSCNDSVDLSPEAMEIRNCWGWKDTMEAATDIFSSIHNSLLEGEFIFGYKNTSGAEKSDLAQIIVVRFRKGIPDLGTYECSEDMFGIGVMTTGYTMLLPRVPISYIESVLMEDLTKWKLEKKILNTFKRIIEDLKNETISN